MHQPFDPGHEVVNRSPQDSLRLLSGDYWGELRVFLAVAKAKSYNKAADALNSSQPTVSRQVKRLQDIVGSNLLVSSKSGIELTIKGEELFRELLKLDEKLGALANDLRAETREAEGLVRVTSTEALAGLFIVPGVPPFHERFPKIQLHVRNPNNLVSLRENNTDVLVGYAPSDQAGVEAQHAGFLHLIPVASQAYVARYGVPTRTNLEDHFFVDTEYYSSQHGPWAGWRSAVGRGTVAHYCDNSFAYALLVKAGQGIGLLGNFTLADPDAVPLDIGVHVALPIYIVALAERLQSRPVKIVYDWLCDIFSGDNPWFSEKLNVAYPQALFADTFARVTVGTPLADGFLPK